MCTDCKTHIYTCFSNTYLTFIQSVDKFSLCLLLLIHELHSSLLKYTITVQNSLYILSWLFFSLNHSYICTNDQTRVTQVTSNNYLSKIDEMDVLFCIIKCFTHQDYENYKTIFIYSTSRFQKCSLFGIRRTTFFYIMMHCIGVVRRAVLGFIWDHHNCGSANVSLYDFIC